MRQKNIHISLMALLCFLFTNGLMSQSFVKDIDVKPNEARITFEENPNMGYLIEIGGPGSYYWRTQVINEKDITFKNKRNDGGSFADGNYTMQITPIILLTPEQREKMREVSSNGTMEEIAALRTELNIPKEVKFYNYEFHINQGAFALPKLTEEPLKAPSATAKISEMEQHFGSYVSLNQRWDYSSSFTGRAWDQTAFTMDDQVILDDLIVDGSACIGQDCVNGESFGFDTVRLKENNLRIKAQDTSNSASFPSRDWQITFNDSSNGGANKFSIDDIDGGKTPFTIEAGAPSHSLFVDDGGRIGLGTSTPVVEMHSKDGDTPTLRLEQDGSSGFTAQTWDVAGNETNFFIRDATGGSTLPFKILKGGAPSNSLVIAGDGKVGLGTATPSHKLTVCGDFKAVAMGCTSDERFKKNISPLERSLEKVLQLKGVNYDWRISEYPDRGFTKGTQVGLVAQELELIYPELVHTDEEGYKSVNYASITPILVEAIKEQNQIILSQGEEIEALRQEVSELAQLKAQVAQLTQLVMDKEEESSSSTEEVGKE